MGVREALLHEANARLAQWKEDLEELQDAGAPPSRETTLKSLKHLLEKLKDLKNPMEIVDLFAPDDVRALHSFGVAAAGAEINQ